MRTKIKLEIAWIPGQSSETAFMPTSLPFMPAHFTDFAFKTQAIEEILADKPLALPSASLGSNSVHELGFYDIAFLTGQGVQLSYDWIVEKAHESDEFDTLDERFANILTP